MSKSIVRFVPPLLVGVVLGYYMHDLSKPPAHSAPGDENSGLAQMADAPAPLFAVPASVKGKTAAKSDDIKSALQKLDQIIDIHERASRLKELLSQWAEQDAQGAFDYANAMDEGELKAVAIKVTAKALAISNPQYLAKKALAMPGNRSRREAIEELTTSLAKTDASSALQWAEQLPGDLSKKDALAITRSALARQNPAEAAGQLSQLPPGDSRNNLITTIAEHWGAEDPGAAVQWATNLPEKELALAMWNLTGAWAQVDPANAANYVAQLPPGDMQNQCAMAVVSSWSVRDPAATANWVIQFPETLQQQGLREVINAWITRDSQGAQAWANNLPEGATRDTALQSFADGLAYWAPEKAAKTAESIADPSKREEALTTTLRIWLDIDPGPARAWLASLDISQELKDRLAIIHPLN